VATEKTSVDGLFQAVNEMIGRLPLQDCTWETNPVTRETGWKAPHGKAFKITGSFGLDTDGPDIAYCVQPLDSFDLYISRDSVRYQELLAENNGNQEAALRAYKHHNDDDWIDIPDLFEGKWLIMKPEPKNGQFKLDEKGEMRAPQIMVKGDVISTYEHDLFGILKGIHGPRGESVPYSLETGEIVWHRYQATAVIGSSRIELVDFQDIEPEFFIPDEKPKEIEIVSFPESTGRGTSFEYALRYRLTEEERIDAKLRMARWKHPFDDDILGRNGVVAFRRDWVEWEDDKLIDAILATSATGVFPEERKIVTTTSLARELFESLRPDPFSESTTLFTARTMEEALEKGRQS